MLREELQSYIDSVYPGRRIENEYSIGWPIHLRFELGDKLENGTLERVNQAVDRALTIFNHTFDNPEARIWVLIYEYSEPNFFNASNNYLHQQFPEEQFANFYNQVEQLNIPNTDDNGKDIFDKQEARIIIGKIPVKEINIKNILTGIANTEMGFDPGIDQRVFFFDPFTDKAFYMYDDRGCLVWSDTATKIAELYVKYNNWIVDYHRPEIDQYFK